MIWYELVSYEKRRLKIQKLYISSACFGGNETAIFARLPTLQSPLLPSFFPFFLLFLSPISLFFFPHKLYLGFRGFYQLSFSLNKLPTFSFLRFFFLFECTENPTPRYGVHYWPSFFFLSFQSFLPRRCFFLDWRWPYSTTHFPFRPSSLLSCRWWWWVFWDLSFKRDSHWI